MNNIKQLTEADYDDIFHLSEFAFQYKLSPEELELKKQEAFRHTIWGWMDRESIAAKVHLIPLACYLNGKTYNMGGISAVATWPQYRRQGMVKGLLNHALQQMRKNGQTVSYLHPFSVPFYRKYGWEICFTEKHCTIPMESMQQHWDGHGYVRIMEADIQLLQQIYTDYAKQYNGMMTRDEKWWQHRILQGDFYVAVSYNADDQPEGYLIYDVKKEQLSVKDFAYTSMNGWKVLLQFMANHDSMAKQIEMVVAENEPLCLLLEKPVLKQNVQTYFMARIVDVAGFLQSFDFAAGDSSVTLAVTDTFLPENNGLYHVIQHGDISQVIVGEADSAPQVHVHVQELAQLLFGFARPTALHRLNKIQGTKDAVARLERMLPDQQTFLADFF